MLILVAVTVRVTVNSGLFGHAQEATGEYAEKQAQEQAIGDGTFSIIVNGEEYSSLEEFLAANPGAADPTLTTDRSSLKVGDYIDYTPDSAGEYSLTSEVSGHDTNQSIPQDKLQWRVMNIHEDGSVDLVSATPTSTNVYFSHALGYNNGVYVLNDMCEQLYSNTTLGVTGRSLDLVDIENKMNDAGISKRDSYVLTSGSIKTQYGVGTQTYSGNYSYAPDIFGKTGTSAEEKSKDYYESPTDATYEKKDSITVTQTYYNFGSTTSTTYFDDQTFYELMFKTGKSYWLASRYSSCTWETAKFGLRYVSSAALYGDDLFYSKNSYGKRYQLVRPVVTLGPDIQISTVGGTSDAPKGISLSPGATVPGGTTDPTEPGDTTGSTGSTGQTLTTNRSGLKIGDYVDYTPDTASAYSLTSAVSGYDTAQSIPQDTLQWRIMSINEDGSVDLISATPTSTDVYFKEALGYNNCVTVLNNICKEQYSNTSLGVTGRSIKIEDIENKFNSEGSSTKTLSIASNTWGLSEGTYIQSVNTENNTVTYVTTRSKYPDIYQYENGSGINTTTVKTDGIGESDEYSGSGYPNGITTNTSENANTSGLTVTPNSYSFAGEIERNFTDSTFYDLIFQTSYNYWIASRCVYCTADYPVFSLRCVERTSLSHFAVYFDTTYNYTANYSCLRPVVSLGSNIKISTTGGAEGNPRTIGL